MSSAKPISTRLGTVLFRFRSFTPVPVIAVLFYILWRSRGVPGPGGAEVDAALNIVGLAVSFTGQALRFWTLAQVPDGTSGQGSELEAVSLNTRGPYSFVRNPLYVGNLFICLGLMLIAHNLWVYAIGLAFFFGEYFFIIRAEEAFLRQTFGPPYEDFLSKVPRWVPRFTPAYSHRPGKPLDVRRALKKEHNPFAAWASGALVLLGWELAARGELSLAVLRTLVGLEIAVLLTFAVIKAYKRGWLFAH